jgi:NADPH:quinone reductase-like Zn-dependent oxidoreductase
MDNHAVCLPRFGDADVLSVETIAVPRPAQDEILVRVAAASVNPVDFKTREGKFPPVTQEALPIVLGRDLAGTVEAVGDQARTTLKEGQSVFAFIGTERGAQSDYVLVKSEEVAASPQGLDMVHAAAVPLAALTAWQGLFDHGGLSAGQSVLIHRGAGGVGHFAVQLAKAEGAKVYATCSAHDLDFVRDLGADVVIDYKAERFENRVEAVDVVLDLVGGETQERSWAVIRPGGIMVSTLQAPDPALAAKHQARSAPRYMAHPDAGQLRQIAALIEQGKVRVVVSQTLPLAQVRAAQEQLAQGHLRGKMVLTLGEDDAQG